MQKKSSGSNISGAIPSVKNRQLLISTGIPSLDDLLGGGVPVGTVVLLEEDVYGSYSKVILKYFVAEGIVCNQSVLIASQDLKTTNFVNELPDVISADNDPECGIIPQIEKMKIAFRYHNLPTNQKEIEHKLGHYYDLSTFMPKEKIEQAKIFHWHPEEFKEAPCTFSNPAYHHLLETVKNQIRDGNFFVTESPEERSILRVGLYSVGSPLWYSNKSLLTIDRTRDLDMFIYCLRALIRQAYAVAVVTVPQYLFDEDSLGRCRRCCDIVLKLQSFAGTELENNRALSNYHGFFHLIKLAAINTWASKHPGSVELVFKLKRKKFCIETLHLPPDIVDSSSNSNRTGCGGSTGLDF